MQGKSKNAKLSRSVVTGMIEEVEGAFPDAMPVARMAKMAAKILQKVGYTEENTLLATSLSSDEIMRNVEEEIGSHFGPAYHIGGLAGYCFGGIVGFGNMEHHVPENGLCLVVYGPHTGIDMDLNFGRINRPKQRHSTECCGPSQTALEYCRRVKTGERNDIENPRDIIESQQTWVCKEMLSLVDRIDSAENPDIELPLALFDSQEKIMRRIVEKAGPELHSASRIALLGGITINTPEGIPEYFVPKKFAIVDNTGKLVVDLLEELLAARAPVPSRLRNKVTTISFGSQTYG